MKLVFITDVIRTNKKYPPHLWRIYVHLFTFRWPPQLNYMHRYTARAKETHR